MKYTSTARTVNLTVFTFLFLAFGCLAFYFCFWVDPGYFVSGIWEQSMIFNGDYPYNWAMQFGMIGMAVMLLSAVGIYYSIKAMNAQSKDEDVVKCFYVYGAIGNALALFFLLNSVFFYALIPHGTSQTFFIILFVILFIAALLGSNIPMSKLLDDDDGLKMQEIFSGALGSLLLGYLLATLPTLFVTLAGSGNYWGYICRLAIYDVLALFAFLCCLFSALVAHKGKKSKLPAVLFGGSWTLIGVIIMVEGTIEWLWHNASSTYSLNGAKGAYAGLDYVVMGCVVGSILVVLGLAYACAAFLPEKKKTTSHRA
ncbi:MAG: hypothetical protein Q4F15_00595 [Bacillota bacterium]|nr:hypothetical protein [Bacillota bacterium]